LEGGESHEWVAYLRGDRLEVEIVIPTTGERSPEPDPNTPADTSFIAYQRP
jgi:hypothetical protein